MRLSFERQTPACCRSDYLGNGENCLWLGGRRYLLGSSILLSFKTAPPLVWEKGNWGGDEFDGEARNIFMNCQPECTNFSDANEFTIWDLICSDHVQDEEASLIDVSRWSTES